MGAGGGAGFIGRAFGGIAARNGAVLTGNSISSVASRDPGSSGMMAGDIADRSLSNYMPQLGGYQLSETQISGGRISTFAVSADGKEAGVELYSAAQFEKPEGPYSMVTASDGSQWYQMAGGAGAGAFYDAPFFTGSMDETARVAAAFPGAPEGTTLRTAGEGLLEACGGDGGNALWYNSAYYEEPDAPHTVLSASNGVEWYAMQPHAETPEFESGEGAASYNRASFQSFLPGYPETVSFVDGSGQADGRIEVRHADGSGTRFYDSAQYAAPRGDYRVFEDSRGGQWYAVSGTAAAERRPVYQNGQPVYDGDSVRTEIVETVRYPAGPSRFGEPKARKHPDGGKPPKRKRPV